MNKIFVGLTEIKGLRRLLTNSIFRALSSIQLKILVQIKKKSFVRYWNLIIVHRPNIKRNGFKIARKKILIIDIFNVSIFNVRGINRDTKRIKIK